MMFIVYFFQPTHCTRWTLAQKHVLLFLSNRGRTSPEKLWPQTEATGAAQWNFLSPSPTWRTSLHSGKRRAMPWSYQKTPSETLLSWYILYGWGWGRRQTLLTDGAGGRHCSLLWKTNLNLNILLSISPNLFLPCWWRAHFRIFANQQCPNYLFSHHYTLVWRSY